MDGDEPIAGRGLGKQGDGSKSVNTRARLAIVSTHPIQYYAPWFRFLADRPELDLRVFYLLEPPRGGLYDPGFTMDVQWDTALLEGYPYEFVPNTRAQPSTSRFTGLRNPSLSKRVAEFVPDAVLVIGYAYWSVASFVLGWPRSAAPLIFRGDSHRLAAGEGFARRIKDTMIASFFKRFASFIYVGQANYRYFRLHGVDAVDLFHAPHAVDDSIFRAPTDEVIPAAAKWRSELGIANGHAVVLFAGKFEEKKRPLDLLAAFGQLALPNTTLLFVGSGPLEEKLRAAAIGVANVVFAPFQNQSLMPRTYAACDLMVLASHGEFETWGLSVNEAMHLEKPVIVSSHVGCAEDLVVPGETGMVFEAGNIEALRDALRSALSDRRRLELWGRTGGVHVGRYSYGEATRGLLEAVAHGIQKKQAFQ